MAGLTVIIPALNAMPYLPEALASLEAQTFRHFEVILWDNGSTDGTVEEARRWIPERLPGRVVSDQPLPLHLCLARMVEEAKTDYVARMDADDVCLPERFRRQFLALESDHSIAVVGSQIQLINPEGAYIDSVSSPILPSTYGEILIAFLFANPLAHPTVMFRRQHVLEAGNYQASSPVEDFDLWMRVAIRNKVINLEDTLLLYRRHESAVCGGIGAENARINNLMIATTMVYCQDLFGMDPAAYCLLRENTHGFSAYPIAAALISVAKRSGQSVVSLAASSTVCFVARCLTGARDLGSRALIKLVCSVS